MNRRGFRKALFLSAAIGLFAIAPALAQEKLIVVGFAGTNPKDALREYFEEVNKKIIAASGGLVEFDIRVGFALANYNNMIDRITGDVVQIGWTQPAMFGDRFALTETASLPFVVDDPVVGSVALYRLFKTGLLDSEYSDLVPLMFALTGVNSVHFSRPLNAPDDFKGMKIRAGSKPQSQAVQIFGGTPMVFATAEMYEALQRRTVDGVVVPWTAFRVWKLNEVTTYHVDIPFGGLTSAMMMSKKRFEALPARARKAIEDNAAQEANSRHWAEYFVTQGTDPRAEAEKRQHKTVKLPPAQEAMWKERVNAVVLKEWFEKNPSAQRVFDTYNKIYAEVKAGK
jgi:TRAP-type C4-dicarboxylate transport system substrate-binding protein